MSNGWSPEMVGMIKRVPWHDRLALGIVAFLLLAVLILQLAWIPSLLEAVLGQPEQRRSYALSADTESSVPGQINLQLQLVAANEVRRGANASGLGAARLRGWLPG